MAKRKKERVNPNRRKATQADVKKAKREAASEAIDAAWAIFFTALRDKEGFGPKRLRRVWDEVNAVSESISQGYVDVRDLMAALREEAGITLTGGDHDGKQ